MDDLRREALLKEYGEVNSNFRLLTDIRFKLLAFLPIASAAAAAFKGDNLGIGGFALSLFGLAVTIGLVMYNTRNDQLYNTLVGRAASIERSLAIPDGAFANRPRAWFVFNLRPNGWFVFKFLPRELQIDHGTSIRVIYLASIALWTFGAIAPIMEYIRRGYVAFGLPTLPVDDPVSIVNALALVPTVGIAYAGNYLINEKSKKQDEERMSNAAKAVAAVKGAQPQVIPEEAELHAKLFKLCADLSGQKLQVIESRAGVYSQLADQSRDHYIVSGSPDVTGPT